MEVLREKIGREAAEIQAQTDEAEDGTAAGLGGASDFRIPGRRVGRGATVRSPAQILRKFSACSEVQRKFSASSAHNQKFSASSAHSLNSSAHALNFYKKQEKSSAHALNFWLCAKLALNLC